MKKIVFTSGRPLPNSTNHWVAGHFLTIRLNPLHSRPHKSSFNNHILINKWISQHLHGKNHIPGFAVQCLNNAVA